MFFGILNISDKRSRQTNKLKFEHNDWGSRPSIAFVHSGSFSHANHSLLAALQHQFADTRFDVLDLMPLVRGNREILVANLLHMYREFGKDILAKRKNFQRAFYSTTYLFRKRSELATRFVLKKPRLFSIQTQSLFDANTPGLPHFLYTDHTMLANLRYPDITNLRELGASDKWLRMETALYRNTTVNFTMSSNISRSMVEEYGAEPGHVVRAYAGGNVESAGSHGDGAYMDKNILFVGVDWERKGGPQLVEAFKQVRQKHPIARLTIVGCSPELHIPGCRVVGRVPKEEVSKYYEDATLFCMPTRREPFGFVFLEAMQHGLPLVATNIGAIPDFLHHGRNGYLTQPDDIQGLADALCRLLDDPQKCREFGQQSTQIVQPYQWDNVAAIMKETIQQHIALSSAPLTMPIIRDVMHAV